MLILNRNGPEGVTRETYSVMLPLLKSRQDGVQPTDGRGVGFVCDKLRWVCVERMRDLSNSEATL